MVDGGLRAFEFARRVLPQATPLGQTPSSMCAVVLCGLVAARYKQDAFRGYTSTHRDASQTMRRCVPFILPSLLH